MSNHPTSTKIGLIKCLSKRNKIVSSNKELEKEEEHKIINLLSENDYPRNFTLKHIKERPQNNNENVRSNIKPRTTITIPYIRGISEKLKRISSQYNIRMVFNSTLKLKNTLVNYNYKYNKNVIYKIPCKDCNQVYIGQTGAFLDTRIKQHQYSEKTHKQESTLVQHIEELNHRINYKDTEIVNYQQNKFKRLFMESAIMKYKFKDHFSKESYTIHSTWDKFLQNLIL